MPLLIFHCRTRLFSAFIRQRAITGLVSLIGMWYALQADIQANVFKIDTLGKEIDRLRDGENN